MAATAVQSNVDKQGAATVTSFTASLPNPITVNNTVWLVVASDSTVQTPAGYTLATSAVGSEGLYLFYKTAGVGEPTSFTVTLNATAKWAYYIEETSGLAISGQLDQVANHTGITPTTSRVTGTTAATSQADEYIVCAAGLFHQNSGATIVSSWSGITGLTDVTGSPMVNTGSGNQSELSVATTSVAATGSYAGTANFSASNTNNDSTLIVTFKILAAGTPVAATATQGTAVTAGFVFTAAPTATVTPITVTATQATAVTQQRAVGLTVRATQPTSATGMCGLQKSITVSATVVTSVTAGLVRRTNTVTVSATQTTSVSVSIARSTFARQLAAVTVTAVSVTFAVTRSVSTTPRSFQVETWLSEVEMHLLSGDKDERNLLEQPVGPADTILHFAGLSDGIQTGAYIGVGIEVMYVLDRNDTANSCTVIRGALASVPADHPSGTVVYVNPRFSRWQMFKALNAELRDLSAPPNMIFQVKSFALTTQPVAQTYAVPAQNLDIISLLELRYTFPDANKAWPRIPRNHYSVLRNMPTDTFSSGMALRLDEAVYPGRTMQVRYAAPLGELVNLTDDILTQTGLPATAADIPPLGAAARLMGVREAKRSFTETSMDAGRQQMVPSGSAARAAGAILAVLNQRIRSEASRLKTMYPETV